MEPGTDPIDDAELLYRRVPVNPPYYDPCLDSRVTRKAFRPRKGDHTGLSLQRAKYLSPKQVARNDRGKQYYVAVLRAGDLRAHGMDVVPVPEPGNPGHAEMSCLHYGNRETDRAEEWQLLMAEKLCLDVLGPYGLDTDSAG